MDITLIRGRAVMCRFPCPFLQGEVELTEERERHIAARHPDLLPEHRERIAETLADLIRSVGACSLAAPSSFLDGTPTYGGANTSSLRSSASLSQVSVTGSSQHTSPESWQKETLHGVEINI